MGIHGAYLQVKDSLQTNSEHISELAELALSSGPSFFSCSRVLHLSHEVAWSWAVMPAASLDPNVLSGAITRLSCVADLHSLRHGLKVWTDQRREGMSVDWAVASFQWTCLKLAQAASKGPLIKKCPFIKQCATGPRASHPYHKRGLPPGSPAWQMERPSAKQTNRLETSWQFDNSPQHVEFAYPRFHLVIENSLNMPKWL